MIRIWFFIFLGCLCQISLVYGQKFVQIEKYYSTPISRNDIYGKASLLDSADLNLIGQFVVREANRLRMALHPAFTKLDSIAPKGSAKRAELEQNPYAIFPEMAGYRYTPKWEIYRFSNSSDYLRNLYWVEIKDCFTFANAAAKPKFGIQYNRCYGRNNYYVDDGRPVFFPNDGIYSVFYCKENGTLQMMGGNASLEQWPEAAVSYNRDADEDVSMLFASLRLVHFSSEHPMRNARQTYRGLPSPDYLGQPFNLESYDDEYHPNVYFHRDRDAGIYPGYGNNHIYYFFDVVHVKTGKPELDSIPEAILYTQYHETQKARAEREKLHPVGRMPARPWGPVTLTYYIKKGPNSSSIEYLKTLPPQNYIIYAYEVQYTIVDKPTRYEQLLPKVRGITSDEWAYLKRKDPKLVLNE